MVYQENVLYCKGTKVNSFGIPLYLLKDKSRIKGEGRKRKFYNISFDSPFKKDSPKNLIVMYDIPSDKNRERLVQKTIKKIQLYNDPTKYMGRSFSTTERIH